LALVIHDKRQGSTFVTGTAAQRNAIPAVSRITPLRAAVRFVRERLARYRPQAWRLEGRERASSTPLVIVFAGQLENKNYISHLAFADSPVEKALGRRWLWMLLPPKRKRVSDGVDLRIVELYESQRRWLRGALSVLSCPSGLAVSWISKGYHTVTPQQECQE